MDRAALRWWGLLVICTAIFIDAVDATIVNVALTDISTDLDAGLNELQWVVDAFLVTLAGLLVLASGLADRFGRRRIFVLGMVLFAASSLLAAAAERPEVLIGARALMGAAIACVLPTALALIAVMFDGDERTRAVAIWAAIAGLGMAAGPLIGGLLIDVAGWRWIFLFNVPFAVAAVPAALWLLPESRRPGAPPLDLPGAGLSIVALGGIVFALIEGQARGWSRPAVVIAAVLGVLALFAFVARELRVAHPLFDVRVLARGPVRDGSVALLAIYGSFMGLLFLIPQYVELVHDTTALAAGALVAPTGLGLALTSPSAGRLTTRYGAPRVMSVGLAGMAVSFVPLLAISPDGPLVRIALGALLYGLALGITVGPATVTIMADLGVEKAGDGSAVSQLSRQVGGALGVALVGSLLGFLAERESVTAATRGALILCAAFLVAALALALLGRRRDARALLARA